MVDYVLEENLLTSQEPNDRCARVVNVRSYNGNDLIERIAKSNIGISKAEAAAMVEAMTETVLEWLGDGASINLPFVHLHPSIPGAYKEGEYPHNAVIRATPSKEVTELAKKISLRHVEPISPIRIETIYDVKSDTLNSMITSGGTVKIKGHNLKIQGTNPTVGVEFINANAPSSIYPVALQDVVINNPSELMLIAPAIASGEEVLLKITTQFSSSKKDLKLPRSTTFEKRLIVI
jgi:nucleoid DNA-binding protein